ncbi:MAG: 3-deoxy-D-manno-octulosonic-acid transferase [Pelagibacterales bacterium]|nr:3-deoxy-D-manno-octulosonic-acid transferase [Pelagibacterales bacterium]
MLFVYNILINFIILISPLIIILRIFKKKEHPVRFKEKFCFFSKKRVKGKLLWFHGSSVGEILSVIPLIEKLEKNDSINQILITSSTLSSSSVLSKFRLKKTVHQFFPIDSMYYTKKFLKYWNPSAVIFIESEIWPNMITNIKKKSIPLILLNARITKKSYRRWKRFSNFAKSLFNNFDIAFPQNTKTKKYLKYLNVKKIKLIGNLKFAEVESIDRNKINKKLKNFFNSKKIWCAASTHKNEELIAAITHNKLKKKYKNLLTIIIPRHIQRVDQISKEIKHLNLPIHYHSSNTPINKNTEIYLVDTYGETKLFFKICKTVFLGGSMIKHGGQNPLEACRFGCKIIHGPFTENFEEIYDLLDKNKLSFKVNNLNKIIKLVDTSLVKKSNKEKKINKLKLIGKKILNNTLIEFNKILKN